MLLKESARIEPHYAFITAIQNHNMFSAAYRVDFDKKQISLNIESTRTQQAT